jgi:endonuclease/exonuclease/phosphatase family metal-dependent hydrolase
MLFYACTYNVMAPVNEPLRYTGQKERMMRIPEALSHMPHFTDLDVLVVQESIQASLHHVLGQHLLPWGFTQQTGQLHASWKKGQLVQGGVVIFSRRPITRVRKHVFRGLCQGADCLAAKGCVYARIDKGTPVHVVALHLQAWEMPHTRQVRRCQIHQVYQFIQSLRLPPNEPLVILGDLNVDRYTQGEQLDALLAYVNCEILPLHTESHPFSSDPATNSLVGIDEDTAYRSAAYPRGCYWAYMKDMHCMCCPQEWLDYAAVAQGEWDRVESYMRVWPLKTTPFTIRLSFTHYRTIQDLSDHYPVLVKVAFPHYAEENKTTPIPQLPRDPWYPMVLGGCLVFLLWFLVIK